jgi:hypothetical protein
MTKKEEAQDAIWDAVKKIADSAHNYSGAIGSAMLRDAAIAYRAAAGGSQPGSVTIEK